MERSRSAARTDRGWRWTPAMRSATLVMAAHIYRQGLMRTSPLEAAMVTNQLQADSKLPLLLAADLERGLAPRLKDVPDFLWPMAFGAVDDPAEAERVAMTSAFEVRDSSDDDDNSLSNPEGCQLYI
ncbi:MAG TPA: hypothetical protein VFQ24_12265 [Terriglobia bacterium]|nr:hypothetical protein [Terriglobia bacterium]